MAILGELDRASLINRELPTVHSASMEEALNRWDLRRTQSESVRNFYRAAPGGVPTQIAFSRSEGLRTLTRIAQRDAFVTLSMPFRSMVVLRFCPAISRLTVAS